MSVEGLYVTVSRSVFFFLFIIFHCCYLHLYLYTYHSVPLVP